MGNPQSRIMMHDGSEVLETPAYYEEEFWGRGARMYDPVVKLLLLPFGGEKKLRQGFVAFANPGKGEQVLDVCCGTGTLTALLAQRVGTRGSVVAVDLSAKMIAVAQKKVKVGLPLTFERANSENLPFPRDIFDKSFVSLGLHEMPAVARQNSLREVYRILKPGGGLFVLDFNLAQGALARLAIKTFVRLFEKEAAYLMLLEGTLPQEIEQAGFVLKQRRLISGGIFQMLRAEKSFSARRCNPA